MLFLQCRMKGKAGRTLNTCVMIYWRSFAQNCLRSTKFLDSMVFLLKNSESNPSMMFFEKVVLKISNKSIAKHPCRCAISIHLQSNFIKLTFRHGCSPVKLTHVFRTPFAKNISGGLLGKFLDYVFGDCDICFQMFAVLQ